jgi:hypothetical protein
MKKNVLMKGILVLLVIALLTIGFTGCGTVTPPLPPPGPTYCTLTVYSQNYYVYGYVWVNGASSGQWIDFNGSVTIQGLTAGTVAYIQIVDSDGYYSHQEIISLQSGTNILIFDYF